jgi:drug/metabolite transporter (DMT)-like permease
MNGFTLGLLAAAAVLHAIANVVLKQARDKLAFTWWILGVSALVGVPIACSRGGVDRGVWAQVVASGLLEAVYFATLARAYALGDLSQVYPIARGSAPLFTLVWATWLLGERPSALGIAGVATVVAGLYLVNLPSLSAWRRPLAGLASPVMRWSLVTGVAISAYSIVDKIGVRSADPLSYLCVALTIAWIAMSAQWLSASRRAALVAEVRGGAGRLALVAGGALAGLFAYTLVLAAMRRSPVSYVSAVREMSVVLGAWIGVRFLGERGGALRVAAAALVAAGILAIALGG